MRNEDKRKPCSRMRRSRSRFIQIFIFSCFLSVVTWASAEILQVSDTSLLHVNFISIGAGIDYKAEDRFLYYLKGFQNENHVTIGSKMEHWGKEGETEYVLDLKKLSPKQQKDLEKTVTEMFKDNKRVKLGKSSSC